MDDEAMRCDDGNIAPSHRPIASPHRPSHRLIVHRIASSSIASPHRLPLRNASWSLPDDLRAFLTHWYTAACAVENVLFRTK